MSGLCFCTSVPWRLHSWEAEPVKIDPPRLPVCSQSFHSPIFWETEPMAAEDSSSPRTNSPRCNALFEQRFTFTKSSLSKKTQIISRCNRRLLAFKATRPSICSSLSQGSANCGFQTTSICCYLLSFLLIYRPAGALMNPRSVSSGCSSTVCFVQNCWQQVLLLCRIVLGSLLW